MNKALIKVLTLTTLLPMATIVQADMKPYIEGQINYSSPDDDRYQYLSLALIRRITLNLCKMKI